VLNECTQPSQSCLLEELVVSDIEEVPADRLPSSLKFSPPAPKETTALQSDPRVVAFAVRITDECRLGAQLLELEAGFVSEGFLQLMLVVVALLRVEEEVEVLERSLLQIALLSECFEGLLSKDFC